MGTAPVLPHCYLLRYPWPQPTDIVKDKPTICSPIFMAFPCDRIPKVTEDVHVHFFIHSSNSCKFTSQFRERFEAAAVGAVGVGVSSCAQSALSFVFVYIPHLLCTVALWFEFLVNLQICFWIAVAFDSIGLFRAVNLYQIFCLVMYLIFGDNIVWFWSIDIIIRAVCVDGSPYLPSAGIVRRLQWQFLTHVSEKPIGPIFRGQAIKELMTI